MNKIITWIAGIGEHSFIALAWTFGITLLACYTGFILMLVMALIVR